jgi:hypothetical protein
VRGPADLLIYFQSISPAGRLGALAAQPASEAAFTTVRGPADLLVYFQSISPAGRFATLRRPIMFLAVTG